MLHIHVYIYIWLTNLIITPITMLYSVYIYRVDWGYKPTNITGAAPP